MRKVPPFIAFCYNGKPDEEKQLRKAVKIHGWEIAETHHGAILAHIYKAAGRAKRAGYGLAVYSLSGIASHDGYARPIAESGIPIYSSKEDIYLGKGLWETTHRRDRISTLWNQQNVSNTPGFTYRDGRIIINEDRAQQLNDLMFMTAFGVNIERAALILGMDKQIAKRLHSDVLGNIPCSLPYMEPSPWVVERIGGRPRPFIRGENKIRNIETTKEEKKRQQQERLAAASEVCSAEELINRLPVGHQATGSPYPGKG